METMFYHGLTTDNQRFTVAGKIVKDDIGADLLKLSIAICSSTERFIKKMGRIKAESRLIGSKYKGLSLVKFEFEIEKGKERQIFYSYVSEFSQLDSRLLKKHFNLYHTK